jgi:hypothetical protein
VRLSAFVKGKDVQQGGLWMRVDTLKATVGFDNMQNRPVAGTTDWKKYEIVLDVPQEAVFLPFGFLLVGKGQLWADDFQLELVGRDVPVTNLVEAAKESPKIEEGSDLQAQLTRRLEVALMAPTNLDFEGGQ